MARWQSGQPRRRTLERARDLLAAGECAAAAAILGGGVYGAGYDLDFFELFGAALLGCGERENAGRFLFLCGRRKPEYLEAIQVFLARHHDPRNFRQLHSRFPLRARVLWKLGQFPPVVQEALRALGFPEDIQAYFLARKSAKTSEV